MKNLLLEMIKLVFEALIRILSKNELSELQKEKILDDLKKFFQKFMFYGIHIWHIRIKAVSVSGWCISP